MDFNWRGSIGGILIIAVGALWILQGTDSLGQEGGMNGEPRWTLIGAVAIAGGAFLLLWANRRGR